MVMLLIVISCLLFYLTSMHGFTTHRQYHGLVCSTSNRLRLLSSSSNANNNNQRQIIQQQQQQPKEMVFASYVIYKGKGAVSIKGIPPTLSVINQSFSRTVTREGGLLLEFAPVLGPREYDWSKKLTFLCDVSELGSLIATEKEGATAEFIHDPSIGGDNQGQIIKKLKWSPMQDNKGVFLTLSVSDKASSSTSSISVPITYGEVEILLSLFQYCIPRFLAFDKIWDNNGMNPGVDAVSQSNPQPPVYRR